MVAGRINTSHPENIIRFKRDNSFYLVGLFAGNSHLNLLIAIILTQEAPSQRKHVNHKHTSKITIKNVLNWNYNLKYDILLHLLYSISPTVSDSIVTSVTNGCVQSQRKLVRRPRHSPRCWLVIFQTAKADATLKLSAFIAWVTRA